MRILARLAALVVALPGVAVASIESVTFERVLSQATPGLVSYNATLGGGYDLGDIDWTGIVTPLDATTYGYELRMRAWWSGGPQHATIQLGSGYEYPPGTTFTGRSSLLLGVGDPAGTWRFDFYDSYDDGSDGLADARWDTITLGFSAQKPHIFFEGFESSVPPPNWSTVVNNSHRTWQLATFRPAEGQQYATCLFDETLGPQDEWLISPVINTDLASIALGGKTSGSVYYGVTPYDNYDVEAWIINGPGVNDGDDVRIGKLDGFWPANEVWTDFEFDLTGLYTPGQDFRFAFRYHGQDGAPTTVDAVYLTPEPDGAALLATCALLLRRRR